MSKTVSTSGISTAGLLGVVFVTLKLLHIINWSWWWVTLPFWGGAALAITLFLVYLVILAVMGGVEALVKVIRSIFPKK